MHAVRNTRLCTKDCLCLYVCPTGATDTETGQIDAAKCLDGCRACVDACPNGALSADAVEMPVGDQTIRVGRYTVESCRFCQNGACPDTSCATAEPNRLAAACARACLACLEDGGQVKTAYRQPFRRRAPWSLRNFESTCSSKATD